MGTPRLLANPRLNRAAVTPPDPRPLLFHRSWPDYQPTPLREAPAAARRLGVASVLVKDESMRLGLPSFKILGASWATYRVLCQRLGVDPAETPSWDGLAAQVAGKADLTLVAATDGNHGRAVARMARLLGLAAHILVPADMVPARRQALTTEGAEVTVVDGGYDAAVAASAELADDRHLVISDTSWPGYTKVPGWVIDGYSTLTGEILTQLTQEHRPEPSVVVVQIGVGALAASIARGFRDTPARIVGVEPASADCVLASVEAGYPVRLPGRQDSIMAGLNCGSPSLVAWPEVSAGLDVFTAVEDYEAEEAMRLLARDGIVSGESGAAGLAGLLAFSGELGLTGHDRILVISTEGATDPAGYARIVTAETASSRR
jgi:diaminopropionate ammonia-lyase